MKSTIAKLGWYNSETGKTQFEIKTVFDFFTVIGKRPGLFLGKKTITGLYFFYNGYITAMYAHDIDPTHFNDDLEHFIRFIKLKMNINYSPKNWLGLLLDECNQDDEAAFDKFLEYLLDFRQDSLN